MNIARQLIAFTAFSAISAGAGAVGRLADVTVFDRAEGRTLPIYQHEGRHYVVGKPGNEYQVRVRNRTGSDVLTVLSVDGVNAVSGETANWSQSGYVLAPGQAFDVKGWRKSLQRIAAFYFTEIENSYAARTGRPDNVGVIGVAVFRKQQVPDVRIERPQPRPWSRRDGARDAPAESPFPASGDARSAPAQAESPAGEDSGVAKNRAESGIAERKPSSAVERQATLGTGHGRTETSRVTTTSFERATAAPEELIAIHYNTYDNLVAMGVISVPRIARPSPFPGQFVPDPR